MMKNNKHFSKRINYDALKSALPNEKDERDEKDDEDDEDFKEDEMIVDEDEDPIREFKKMQYQSDHDPADFYEEV
jgi:hypothetical protein